MKKLFIASGALFLMVALLGCGISTKQQYPFMKGYGSLSAESQAIILRPCEYAVEDLGEVKAEAYEVRTRFFIWEWHSEGDRPISVMPSFSLAPAAGQQGDIQQSVGPLTKIAIHRAIQSKAGAEALYVTNITKDTNQTGFTEKVSITVTGRALAYKSKGTINENRWDKRLAPANISLK